MLFSSLSNQLFISYMAFFQKANKQFDGLSSFFRQKTHQSEKYFILQLFLGEPIKRDLLRTPFTNPSYSRNADMPRVYETFAPDVEHVQTPPTFLFEKTLSYLLRSMNADGND